MGQYSTASFGKGLGLLGIPLSEKQMQQFMDYYELLVEWNKVMNLTAITEYEEVIEKHFIDSLASVKVCDYSQIKTVIDIGTGAGFPGIPLKIAFPEVCFLQALFGEKCKIFLENVASPNWRKLQSLDRQLFCQP